MRPDIEFCLCRREKLIGTVSWNPVNRICPGWNVKQYSIVRQEPAQDIIVDVIISRHYS